MSWLLPRLLQTAQKRSILLKLNAFSTGQFPRARATNVLHSLQCGIDPSCGVLSVMLPGLTNGQLVHFPVDHQFSSNFSFQQLSLLHKYQPPFKRLPSNGVTDIDYPAECVEIAEGSKQEGVYFMGNLLKKRRRKMNRQKYKKRRNRDRFKRTALKNLREKKRQRRERAFERKQTMLSKMVVNKSISKRRARYLAHKLLPGVVKGQSIN